MSVPTRRDERGVRLYDVPLPRDLVGMLEQTVAEHPDKVAYITDTGQMTWAEFGCEVRGLAGRLVGHGVRSGDRVAVLAGNGLPYTIAVNSIWRVGGTVVPLNYRLTARDLSQLLIDSGARLLLAGPGMENLASEAVEGQLDDVEIQAANAEGQFLAGIPVAAIPEAGLGPDAPAAIMYTSGTTGRPKGVVISHRNALQNSVTCTTVIGRRSDDVELIMVPQFNITGLASQTVPAMHLGMSAVLLDGFDAVKALDAIGRHDVTSTVGAPTMWWRLLESAQSSRRTELDSLRLALFGGAPMPIALISRMRQAMPRATFGNGYGMTETCSMITYVGGAEAVSHAHTVGRPLPLTELRIVSPLDGRPVDEGQVGEVQARGGQVAMGYWTSEGVRPLTDEQGWIATGDAAELEDGFVVLRDRLKDVIKRGGESVFSFEVESCLYQHPGILDAAVVGVPDEQYGERVIAHVVAKPGQDLTPEEVLAHCREHLARFKVPSVVEVREELPRNPGGKVIKSQLRGSRVT